MCEFSVKPVNLPMSQRLNTHTVLSLAVFRLCGMIAGFALMGGLSPTFGSPHTIATWIARADGETDFVRQLLARSMFRTAEDYCERNQSQSTDINLKAEWEQLLSECHSAHAWIEPAVNRSGLMEHAIEHITEFLRSNVIHPERELRLRLRQIELLLQAVRMQDQVEQSGHLMIRPISASLSRNPDHVQSRNEFLSKARELADGLLKQLEQIRSDLDAISVRHLRERTRIASAEISLLQSMTIDRGSPEPGPSEFSSSAELNRADELVGQLSRSVSDEELKFLVAYLGAEVSLVRRDFREFELRQGVLEGLAVTSNQKTSAATLAAAGLLQQRQPTEALAFITGVSNLEQNPQQKVAEFECLLAIYETVRVLAKPDLQTSAADQFRTRVSKHRNQLQGVWLESAQRIERRFELVERYGSEAAEYVAIADQLEAEGKLLEASQSLERLLNPSQAELPDSVRARTALKAGELNIRLRDWNKARGFLEQARNQAPDPSNDPATAAAADLLIAFCLGQTIGKPSQGVDTETPDNIAAASTGEAEYRMALEQHIARYPDSVTALRAREWLAQFLRRSSPQLAAAQYLALFEARFKAHELSDSKATQNSVTALKLDVEPLIECGRLLTSPTEVRDTESSDQATRENFLRMVAAVLTLETIPLIDRTELKLQALELDLFSTPSETSTADWQKFGQTLAELTESIASQRGAATNRLDGFSNRMALIQLIVTACTQPQSPIVSDLQKQLVGQSDRDRERMVLRLHEFYRTRTTGIGNDVLATTITSLLRDRVGKVTSPQPTSPASPPASSGDEQNSLMSLMQLFEIQATAAQRNGDRVARDKLLNVLLKQELSQQELSRAAELMSHGSAATGPRNQQIQSDTLKRFWRSVLKSSPQGSDVWLEASLQAAQSAFADNQPSEARRILGVVDALYPEWGHEDRKTRVNELRKKLEERKP